MGNYSRVCYREENKGHSCSFWNGFELGRKPVSAPQFFKVFLWVCFCRSHLYHLPEIPCENFFSVELEKIQMYCPKISRTRVDWESDNLIEKQFSRKYIMIDTGKERNYFINVCILLGQKEGRLFCKKKN